MKISYIIVGSVIVLLGWIYALIFEHGSCPLGSSVTGCAIAEIGITILAASTILGAVMMVYGLLAGRLKPIPKETLPERKMPTNRL